MEQLKDKIIVVTGSTRGFGWALAQAFAREGAGVVISSRSEAAVADAVQTLRAAGANAAGLACDVSELDQVRALADAALAEYGRIDVWVNNAGISPPYGPTAHVAAADFSLTLQVNTLGAYHGSLVAMRYFLSEGRGKLINILGRGERGPVPMQNAYASSKAWLKSFTLGLAREYEHSGVGVFALSPGMMDTDMILDVEVIRGYEDRLKSMNAVVQALSQPPELSARRAVWLASAATDGKTGLVVRELSSAKAMGKFMQLGIAKLLRRTGRQVSVSIRPIPAEYPERAE
jgi:NAD(P)-dependent dehydrogenase (short-subunit alcohol dehydrogenase family)